MNRRHFAALAFTGLAVASAAAGPAQAAKPPENWDGLVRIKAKKFQLAYLLPGADFRAYAKVMLDPTEIAFQKDWQRDYNNDQISAGQHLTDKDVQKMIADGQVGAAKILQKAYADGGYPVVTDPAADVLRVRTAIVDVRVVAPDRPTAMDVRTFSRDVGEATLVVEARDSMTGALLGRAVDRKALDDGFISERNRVTNYADFSRLVETWAKNSVKGLDELKALSPFKAGDEEPG